MARQSQRNQRRPQTDATARPQTNGHSQNGNGHNGSGAAGGNTRYEKYLPEWMKGGNGAPVRPPRPRRPRQQRPAGGYTPGKFSRGGSERI